MGSHPIETVNRALVEADCAVIALIPEKSDLQSLFESLVDGDPDGNSGAAA